MALSDEEVQKQISHMIAFIDQEAIEKAEEIDARGHEEFSIEKGRLLQQQRLKIMEYYEKKEKQVELQKKIQSSNMLNQARLKVLKVREDHVRNVLEEVRKKLGEIAKDQPLYKKVLKLLIIQGLYQLIEPIVVIRAKQCDAAVVESIIPMVQQEYKNYVKKDVVLKLEHNFLSQESCGGVELIAAKGCIKIDNTLENRSELIAQLLIAEIRAALFGRNVNRKFTE